MEFRFEQGCDLKYYMTGKYHEQYEITSIEKLQKAKKILILFDVLQQTFLQNICTDKN